MLAQILTFPLARRRDLIRRQAKWFAEQSAGAAEANLEWQLQVQRNALVRKGGNPADVEGNISALERAIRSEIGRISSLGGVA